MTPPGVEHCYAIEIRHVPNVPIPMTPPGVEHYAVTLAMPCDRRADSNDAARR